MPAQQPRHRHRDSESDSESESAVRRPGRPGARVSDADSQVVQCPGCKGRFQSLQALSIHRNSIHRRSTACGLLWLRERRHRLSVRPEAAAVEAGDDSDWTDPDIREMMGDGNSHDLPAGAGRGEALPSRDRVSVTELVWM